MNKIRNLKINKNRVLQIIAGLGAGATLLLLSGPCSDIINVFPNEPSTSVEVNIDDDSTVVYNGIFNEFDRVFHESPELVEELSDVYQPIADFVSTHEQFFDESLIKRLTKMQVKQVSDEEYNKDVLAIFDCDSNTMFIKDRIRLKKESEAKEIKEHEFFHFLFNPGFGLKGFNFTHTGLAIDEGIATLLTQEAGDYANVTVFKKNANYIRVICELIGADNFLSAYTNGNLDELYNYLANYISKSDAKELISLIDEACIDYGVVKTDSDKKAWEIVEEAYLNKTGISIKDSNDPIMKYYANKIAGKGYVIEEARSSLDINVQKNYFLNISTPKVVLEHDEEVYGEIVYENNEYVYHPISNKTY